MPTAHPPQLDLFAHSDDTMLRNDVLHALLRRDAEMARAALRALRQLLPRHPALPALDTLVGALTPVDEGAIWAQPMQALRASRQLEHSVAPAALAQLGPVDASAWLAPLWQALARRAAALPFDARQPEAHAAALWLRAGHWPAAEAATQAIESWRRIPAPLGWMAVVRGRATGLDSAWPLLVELAWLAAPRLASVAITIADPLLSRLLRRFDDLFDPDAAAGSASSAPAQAWWPAWLLIDQPALLPHLRQAQAGQDSAPERAFRLLIELLGLERAGQHTALIHARKRLRDLQPALYAAYMASR